MLNSAKIEYLLIGGYAVGLYGYVRPTTDMDIWISLEARNVAGVIGVLEQFGFSPNSLRPEHFTGDHCVFRMGIPPNRIEIVTSIDAVSFIDCVASQKIMTLDGIEVPVISFDDLCKNKLATPRIKDKADVEQLRLVQKR